MFESTQRAQAPAGYWQRGLVARTTGGDGTRYHGAVNTDQSDEIVAAAVQAGDIDAYGELVERYEAKLLRYGRKFLARNEDCEDIVQDVFVRAYQHIQSFDVSQRFSPWIYRIAHNAYINELRKSERRPYLVFDFDTLIPHQVYEDPDQIQREQSDIRVMLERCLTEIPAKYREVLVLHFFEDMAYRDISDVLHVPIGTVGIRIKRAKEALRTAYQTHEHHA